MNLVAWSAIAYPLAGLLTGNVLAFVLLTGLGLASYLYHSKRVLWGGFADVAAMYATFAGLTVWTWAPLVAFPAALAVFALTFSVLWWQAEPLHFKIVPLWAVWVGSIALHQPDWRLVAGGVLCFAAGGALWLTDPKYEKWRHGGWHVLTAVGSALLVVA